MSMITMISQRSSGRSPVGGNRGPCRRRGCWRNGWADQWNVRRSAEAVGGWQSGCDRRLTSRMASDHPASGAAQKDILAVGVGVGAVIVAVTVGVAVWRGLLYHWRLVLRWLLLSPRRTCGGRGRCRACSYWWPSVRAAVGRRGRLLLLRWRIILVRCGLVGVAVGSGVLVFVHRRLILARPYWWGSPSADFAPAADLSTGIGGGRSRLILHRRLILTLIRCPGGGRSRCRVCWWPWRSACLFR